MPARFPAGGKTLHPMKRRSMTVLAAIVLATTGGIALFIEAGSSSHARVFPAAALQATATWSASPEIPVAAFSDASPEPDLPLPDCAEGCAHCAGMLKLDSRQAEYADELVGAILLKKRPATGQTAELRRTCLLLAEAVMLEWSAEHDAPVMQSEETILALKEEMLAPFVAALPDR
jgi:hypothetical protein